mgnify:CR=1 FL=1
MRIVPINSTAGGAAAFVQAGALKGVDMVLGMHYHVPEDRVFMNRKRIDICTKSDRFSWFSSSENTNNTCRCGKVNIDSSEGMKTLRNK